MAGPSGSARSGGGARGRTAAAVHGLWERAPASGPHGRVAGPAPGGSPGGSAARRRAGPPARRAGRGRPHERGVGAGGAARADRLVRATPRRGGMGDAVRGRHRYVGADATVGALPGAGGGAPTGRGRAPRARARAHPRAGGARGARRRGGRPRARAGDVERARHRAARIAAVGRRIVLRFAAVLVAATTAAALLPAWRATHAPPAALLARPGA